MSLTTPSTDGLGKAVAGGTETAESAGTVRVQLTDEQLREVALLLNRGVNVVAEIRLASIPPGAASAAWLFAKQIDHRTADKVRKLLSQQKP